jgi:hypothetical protein
MPIQNKVASSDRTRCKAIGQHLAGGHGEIQSGKCSQAKSSIAWRIGALALGVYLLGRSFDQ